MSLPGDLEDQFCSFNLPLRLCRSTANQVQWASAAGKNVENTNKLRRILRKSSPSRRIRWRSSGRFLQTHQKRLKAYRKATVENPPDRDPEAFRRVRDAFELLSEPAKAADEILSRPMPLTALPKLPGLLETGRNSLLVEALLRRIIGSLPADTFSVVATSSAVKRKKQSDE